MSVLKYSLAYLFPTLAFIALYFGGWSTFLVPVVAFGLIPALELLSRGSSANSSSQEQLERRQQRRWFDGLLHGMVLVQWALIAGLSWRFAQGAMSGVELFGLVISVGICCGTFGINVAHELGHRGDRFSRFSAKCLLLSSLYMHFIIEHNHGHHRRVATDEDPASSRKGESVYYFWTRTIPHSWLSAWEIEKQRLERKKAPVVGWQNEMIWFTVIQIATVVAVALIASWSAAAGYVGAAFTGILLLETVNYVEHYGLKREKRKNGRYERVRPQHSWNSNHPIGRILLFELSRHSDHHAHPTRPYYVLRHFDESPQLPAGYPSMILLALIPPLWFSVMNPHVEAELERITSLAA